MERKRKLAQSMGLKELPKRDLKNVGVVPKYDREQAIREFDQAQ